MSWHEELIGASREVNSKEPFPDTFGVTPGCMHVAIIYSFVMHEGCGRPSLVAVGTKDDCLMAALRVLDCIEDDMTEPISIAKIKDAGGLRLSRRLLDESRTVDILPAETTR